MCEEFLLAASAPLFSFIYTLYATITGDGVSSRAIDAAQKIRKIKKLTDSQFRAVQQIINGYGANVVLVTGLVATVLSYISALFTSRGVFGSSPLYNLSIVALPIFLLIFHIMVTNSIGSSNLFTHKVLSPFRHLGARATFPFTYGSLINASASLCNAVLILVFALSHGVITCSLEQPASPAPVADGSPS